MPITIIQKRELSSLGLWACLATTSAGWGSSFLFTKLIGSEVPPFAFAGIRGFVATTALVIWLALWTRTVRDWREWLPERKILRHIVVLGTTNGWLANVLVVLAVKHADTAVVAMVQAGVPLVVVAMAHFLFKEERFDPRQLVGLAAGAIGILLIVGPFAAAGQSELLISVGAMFLATLSYACGTVYARHVATKVPTALACGQQAFGAMVATLISLAIETPALAAQPVQTWVYFAILGVVCSAVPTVLYLKLIARTTSVRASLVAYLQPVWATLLGVLVLGEPVQPLALCGATLVILGVSRSTRLDPR